MPAPHIYEATHYGDGSVTYKCPDCPRELFVTHGPNDNAKARLVTVGADVPHAYTEGFDGNEVTA